MKKILALMLSVVMLLSSSAVVLGEAASFNAQDFVKAMGLMKGDPDGNFRGGDYLTRAEFVKVAVVTTDSKFVPKSSISPYSDVPYTHWAAGYIDYATAQGMFSGLPDGSFEPERYVKYEELCKVLLIMIGYGTQGYGINWEAAQIEQARHLGILDNSACVLGEYATRDNVAIILKNVLLTKPKDQNVNYVDTIGFKYFEDVLIVADNNVSAGYIATTAGSFKKGILTDDSMKSGDMLVNSNNEIIMFGESGDAEVYIVKAALPDAIVAFTRTGEEKIEFDDDLITYTSSAKMNFASVKEHLQTGDRITVYRSNGQIKCLEIDKDAIEGPIANIGGNFLSALGIASDDVRILLDGKQVMSKDIKDYDICYYIREVDTVLAYSKRISGVYEDALPNKDNLTEVKLSGMVYKVGSPTAFSKLSSDRTSFGDVVTVLFDKNGNIGDIISADSQELSGGYIISTGTKETVNQNGEKGASYFARVMLMDGNIVEYLTAKNCKNDEGYVRKITIESGKAIISKASSANISGIFNWDIKTLGSHAVSTDVKIVDVHKYDITRKGNQGMVVYPQRLDGVKLDSSDILYVGKNKNGEITELALNDVTGDLYKYGMVLKATKVNAGMVTFGQYDVNIGGNLSTIAGDTIYNVAGSQPAQFDMDGNMAKGIKQLTRLNVKVTGLDAKNIFAGDQKYPLSADVQVFQKLNNSNASEFAIIPQSEIKSTDNMVLYQDKRAEVGGRIRIIVVQP